MDAATQISQMLEIPLAQGLLWPEDFKTLPMWVYTRRAIDTRGQITYKAPAQEKNRPDLHMAYDEAKQARIKTTEVSKSKDYKYIGFVPPAGISMVVLDFDINPTSDKNQEGKYRRHTNLSPQAVELLEKHQTYVEASVSGNGLHAHFIMSKEIKELVGSKTSIGTPAQASMDELLAVPMTGELLCAGSFSITTERPYDQDDYRDRLAPMLTNPIKTLSLKDLYEFMPHLATISTRKRINYSGNYQQISTVDVDDVKHIFLQVPAQTSPLLDKAYQLLDKPELQDPRGHWMNGIMILAHAAVIDPHNEEAYIDLAINWSLANPDYPKDTAKGIAEVMRTEINTTKRKMEQGDDEIITKSTFASLAINLKPKFLKTCKLSSGPEKGKLIPEYKSNSTLLTILKHYDIKLKVHRYQDDTYVLDVPTRNLPLIAHNVHELRPMHTESGRTYLLGQQGFILDELLEAAGVPSQYWDSLRAKFGDLLLQSLDVYNLDHVFDPIAVAAMEPYKGVSQWQKYLDTLTYDISAPVTDLDNQDLLVEEIREEARKEAEREAAHYDTARKIELMWLVGVRLFSEETIPWQDLQFMITLMGSQELFKSSYNLGLFKSTPLAPYGIEAEPQQLISSKKGGNSDVANVAMLIRGGAIISIDEAERLYEIGDAEFKAFLTKKGDRYKPPYGRGFISMPRKSLYRGSTNLEKLQLSSSGNRRTVLIPVKNTDTEALLNQIDTVQLLAEVRVMIEEALAKNPGETPWRVPPGFTKYNESLLTGRKKDTKGSMFLQDFIAEYHVDKPFNPKEFYVESRATQKASMQLVTAVMMCKRINETHSLARIAPTEMQYLLEEYCANYTGTVEKPLQLAHQKLDGRRQDINRIERGQIVYNKQKLYILPPVKKG